MKSDEKSFCCTPSEQRAPFRPPAPNAMSTAESMIAATVSLAGGSFLMGTAYEQGFPADGEGPVRPVSLSPFEIDTFPVTNANFATFVEATHYRTEAELFRLLVSYSAGALWRTGRRHSGTNPVVV
jgi:sulfatase modifying factor 1